jgi:hypothetical protein
MASITIKDVQTLSEGLKIEFNINLGVYFSDADLNTDQFHLQVNIKLRDEVIYPARRWDVPIDVADGGRITLPIGGGMLGNYPYDYWYLPENLDTTLGVEQARRVRAIAAMYDSVHSFMMYRCPSGSHDELLRPVDGQEREIHINIPIIINYEVREGSEHLDVRKFSDLLSLENYTWDVHAILASADTRADGSMVFRRKVPIIIDGKIVEEQEEESWWYG